MSIEFDPSVLPFVGAAPDQALADADVVVFGARHGTPYAGIDNTAYEDAPNTLRAALKDEAAWPDHWDFDLGGPLLNDSDYAVADAGDLRTAPLDGAGNRDLIRAATGEIITRGAIPFMLGGDDSTPIPFIEALAPHGPLTIIQIDAHIDWRDKRYDEPLGFSSTMRRASEMAHVENIIQVGMRGLGSARRSEVALATDWGAKLITARACHQNGVEAALQHLSPGANCMITLDCDGLDPAIMPAVMAPTAGGLSYMQCIDLIEGVIAKANLVAFDMI